MIWTCAISRKDSCNVHIVDIEVAFNPTVNSVTPCTPLYINYEVYPRTIPLETLANENTPNTELLETVKSNIKLSKENVMWHNLFMAKQANKYRKDHTFKVTDNVLLLTKTPISWEWDRNTWIESSFLRSVPNPQMIWNVTAKLDFSAPMKAKRIHDTFHASLLKHNTPYNFAINKENRSTSSSQMGEKNTK